MQRVASLITLIFLMSSCSVVGKKTTRHFSLELFEKFDKEITVYKNSEIEVFYKTCQRQWRTSTQAREHLREEFFQKHGQKLIGMSDFEVQATRVASSSILAGQVCFEVRGNPVTLKPLAKH